MRISMVGSLCTRVPYLQSVMSASFLTRCCGWHEMLPKEYYRQLRVRYTHSLQASTKCSGGNRANVITVGYLTDLEGALAQWDSYIALSKVLCRSDKMDSRVELRDDCHFVFGGDVCDHGSGDIRILRDLVHLKEQYPDRVHLILGAMTMITTMILGTITADFTHMS